MCLCTDMCIHMWIKTTLTYCAIVYVTAQNYHILMMFPMRAKQPMKETIKLVSMMNDDQQGWWRIDHSVFIFVRQKERIIKQLKNVLERQSCDCSVSKKGKFGGLKSAPQQPIIFKI